MSNVDEIMLSDEEEAAFTELQRRVCEEFGAEANKFRLLRFLRAREFNVNAAETMFRNNVAWRKDKNMDTFLQRYVPPKLLTKYLPLYLSQLSSESVPILTYQFGYSDLKGILKCKKKDDVMKYVEYILETSQKSLETLSEKLGKQVESWFLVVNFDNSTLFQVTNKPCIDLLMSACTCYEANYPERLERIFIINATIYFNIIFNILKNVLSPVTVGKIKVYRRDGWQEELQKYVSPEMIRIFEGESKITNPSCVITDFNFGGKLPKECYFRSPERRLSLKPGVVNCVLKRNQKIHVPVNVTKSKSLLEWKFETENHDIGFGLSYKMTSDETENKKSLIPIQKFEADMGYEVGNYMCEEPGIYILTFDNTYSWIRQKKLFYSVSVVEPGEEDYIIGQPSLSNGS